MGRLDPHSDDRDASRCYARGQAAWRRGDYPGALSAFEQAARLAPDDPEIRFSRAQMRLALGDLRGGFADYEWRLTPGGNRLNPDDAPDPTTPPWRGQTLTDGALLVDAEQGVGDVLMFLRFLSHARHRLDGRARLILRVPDRLRRLLAAAPGADAVIGRLPCPDARAACKIMSLPHLLRLGLGDVVPRGAYLAAEPARAAAWQTRLAPLTGIRIGVAWQGNPAHWNDANRSVPAALFDPLSRLDGVALLGLQKGPGEERSADIAGPRFVALGPVLDNGAHGFVDTAAVISQLDLVISVDSALVHLAGALGKPCWVLLSPVADWRWMTGMASSPWYPSARLFRRAPQEDWSQVMARLVGELQALIATGALQRRRHP